MAGVAAVVVLTKADLSARADECLNEVRGGLPADVPALAVNGLGSEPARSLAPWMASGQTLVLLGSSGAGKSTLTNALVGSEAQLTGASRAGDGRGRHTTTARSLHLAPQGACIIDTPGLRTLRLDGDAEALQSVFGDIDLLAMQCRFRDCCHRLEPDCAVREGVSAERLRGFHKLQREARRDTLSALERKAQVQQWKARGRESRLRIDGKRGEGG
jgi:ribosome biogenesis GTPase